jgi:hypothetical protein
MEFYQHEKNLRTKIVNCYIPDSRGISQRDDWQFDIMTKNGANKMMKNIDRIKNVFMKEGTNNNKYQVSGWYEIKLIGKWCDENNISYCVVQDDKLQKNKLTKINGSSNSHCCRDCDGLEPMKIINEMTPILYIKKVGESPLVKCASKL